MKLAGASVVDGTRLLSLKSPAKIERIDAGPVNFGLGLAVETDDGVHQLDPFSQSPVDQIRVALNIVHFGIDGAASRGLITRDAGPSQTNVTRDPRAASP